MEPFETTGNYYLISHMTLITGLSDRTIRNYIAGGILHGEKINGLWHFTPTEVEAFLCHPAVLPSIQAKNNAIIYDFMLDQRKRQEEACIILDLPEHDPKTVAEFFCYSISTEGYQGIRFAFDYSAGTPRVILKGTYQDIRQLVDSYFGSIYRN